MRRSTHGSGSLWATLRRLLFATSRTFAIGIEVLPRGLRREVTVAYLVLRVSDYFEDNEVMEPEAKVRALDAWAGVLMGERPVADLEALGALDPALVDSQAVAGADAVMEGLLALDPVAREVVVRHTVDSTRGMARWVGRGPDFADEADLDDYMHEVAGRVGYLLTELFALRYGTFAREREALMPLAREFGLALQTVNVVRGLSSDHRRGWVFVPRTLLAGTDFAAVLAAPGSPASMAILERLADKAMGHLDAAQEYVRRIPRPLFGVRVFCLLPYFLAVRTLALSRANPAVFAGEVKVPRDTVRALARRTRLLWWSNGWIRREAEGLAAG